MLPNPIQTRNLFLLTIGFAITGLLGVKRASAYTVSDLTATYRNGQVFLVWTNPKTKNLQYTVYRSATKITSSTQLTTSNYLGFVRDSSSKNIRLSQEYGEKIFYRIKENDPPLSADKGLYVATCTGNKTWYYAVTVTNLSNGNEDKSIIPSENSLSSGVSEKLKQPLPVLQDSVYWSGGDVVYQYVQFADNQETSSYPAMNSTGSYGFNFYLIKRGNAAESPLFVFYEGLQQNSITGNGLTEFKDWDITDCYILGVDDWLPIPNDKGGIGIGENTFFCCYHEDFNIYSAKNPVPGSGVIKTYPQKRFIESMEWVKTNFPVDDTRVYLVGVSAGGFGALLTASIIPEQIAAVYAIVEPIIIKPVGGGSADLPMQMWGASSNELNSDVEDPDTGDPLSIFTLMNIKKMLDVNETMDLPLIFDVHGKNDPTVTWGTLITSWYDSLQSNHVGGISFWDGRKHDGSNSNFLDTETTPDFYSYQTTKSYPAFSNCTIDQNPGNGLKTSGDNYGALNGYLGWEDVTDEECSYSVRIFVKNFYVGGVLDPDQYSNCKTDLTIRRLQHFDPVNGSTVNWTNYDNTGEKIQSGSFTYKGDLITLKGLTAKKAGNLITLDIPGCQRLEGNDESGKSEQVSFAKSPNGYTVFIVSDTDEDAYLNVYDLLGRSVKHQKITLAPGNNNFELGSVGSGIFLVEVKSKSIAHVEKLMF